MIKVWTDAAEAGLIDRHGERGSTFAYLPGAPPVRGSGGKRKRLEEEAGSAEASQGGSHGEEIGHAQCLPQAAPTGPLFPDPDTLSWPGPTGADTKGIGT